MACGHGVLHVHDYPWRQLYAEPSDPDHREPEVRIARYECAACGAIWRMLPAFLARHLWRSWRVIEAVTVGAPPRKDWPEVAERTLRRWAARLASAARQLIQILATSGQALLEKITASAGLEATREQLVIAHAAATGTVRGKTLASVAALIHRLVPGVRLM
jgi:hypothetical protein